MRFSDIWSRTESESSLKSDDAPPLLRVRQSVFVPGGRMEHTECPPVTVEGDWSPAQTKTVKNKLQLYFQSKKKSSGGECRVEAEDGAPRAAVYFRSEEGESPCDGPATELEFTARICRDLSLFQQV